MNPSEDESVVMRAVPDARIEATDFGFEVIVPGLICGGATRAKAFAEARRHSPDVQKFEHGEK